MDDHGDDWSRPTGRRPGADPRLGNWGRGFGNWGDFKFWSQLGGGLIYRPPKTHINLSVEAQRAKKRIIMQYVICKLNICNIRRLHLQCEITKC